jgi:hypothetical protein
MTNKTIYTKKPTDPMLGRWGGGAKGRPKDNRKARGARRIPRTKRAGRVVAQPREARLQPCPIGCDTLVYGAVDTRLYGFPS